MIGYELPNGTTHVAHHGADRTLCGFVPWGRPMDPHKAEPSDRCPYCWSEWHLDTAARMAADDQEQAAAASLSSMGGEPS